MPQNGKELYPPNSTGKHRQILDTNVEGQRDAGSKMPTIRSESVQKSKNAGTIGNTNANHV